VLNRSTAGKNASINDDARRESARLERGRKRERTEGDFAESKQLSRSRSRAGREETRTRSKDESCTGLELDASIRLAGSPSAYLAIPASRGSFPSLTHMPSLQHCGATQSESARPCPSSRLSDLPRARETSLQLLYVHCATLHAWCAVAPA